jgi:hypothetical protein
MYHLPTAKCNRLRILTTIVEKGLQCSSSGKQPTAASGSTAVAPGDEIQPVVTPTDDSSSSSSSSASTSTSSTSGSPVVEDAAAEFSNLARKLWTYLDRVEALGALCPDPTSSSNSSSNSASGSSKGHHQSLFQGDSKTDKDIVTGLITQDINELPLASPAQMSMEELLAASRWERCGFVHDHNTHNPLEDFSHGGGLLAAKCLLYFLIR